MRQDLRDDRRLLDAGNDLELPAATRTGLDLHPEHPLESVEVIR